MSSRGTVLGGRYTLTERIGGGGMGAVWRADDGVLARQVAVKILHPGLVEDGAFVKRFRREAQLLAALKHPGIVDIHDYGEKGRNGRSGEDHGGSEDHGSGEDSGDDRVAYIVMELVDGQPLDKVLAESGPMPPARALGLLATALDALHAAHRQDIVHRDVKPSNLMVRPDDQVTVTDFGIARAVASTRITASHAVIGTALYMAPEQAEGRAVTPASDLYSIGVVGYELLTGQPPFVGESVLEVALKHIRDPAPELPAALPEAVRGLIATALAKKPEDRFADAAAMAAAARAAIGAASGAPALPAAPVTPVAPAAPATPAGDVGKVESRAATEPGTPRRRRGFLVPIVIPVIITAGTATVLLVDRTPFSSEAKTPGAQSSVTVSAPASTGTPAPAAGTPTAPPPTTPAPTTPGATPGPATQPPVPPAAGTQPGGGTVPSTGGGGSGGASGGGTPPRGGSATQPPANVPAPPAGTPAPAAGTQPGTQPAATTAAPQPPATPPGCGGTNWGAIVNVASGLKLGLSKDSPAGGQAVIMGGTTAYGWVHTVPSSWHQFNPCNLSGPPLVQETDGRVSLSGGFSFLTNWKVTAASTPGAFSLADHMGYTCLTDNGAGNPVTMVTCTPGNKSQEFRIP
ncbi:serine/threonine-protein kinase [Kitasatospora sp. NPDC091207]|uniref:serine/threonine-protein kinase n=1 Tax=Kitasatospora sp. NPDC091207 TaxID=3364083 RepID=UPI003811D789